MPAIAINLCVLTLERCRWITKKQLQSEGETERGGKGWTVNQSASQYRSGLALLNCDPRAN